MPDGAAVADPDAASVAGAGDPWRGSEPPPSPPPPRRPLWRCPLQYRWPPPSPPPPWRQLLACPLQHRWPPPSPPTPLTASGVSSATPLAAASANGAAVSEMEQHRWQRNHTARGVAGDRLDLLRCSRLRQACAH